MVVPELLAVLGDQLFRQPVPVGLWRSWGVSTNLFPTGWVRLHTNGGMGFAKVGRGEADAGWNDAGAGLGVRQRGPQEELPGIFPAEVARTSPDGPLRRDDAPE